MVRDISVGIATRYELSGPGIESPWGGRRDFPQPSGPTVGPHQASYTMGIGSFPGVKRTGRGVDHPPPSSAEVKRRSKVTYLLLVWAFVACFRMKFTFTFYPLHFMT